MILDIKKKIVEVLGEAKSEIQENMAKEGINASGETSNSLAVTVNGNFVRLSNENKNPFETTEEGRPSGKVPENFTDIIFQWHKDKGLNWGEEKEARKIAGAVAWGKIRKFGYGRPSGTFFGSKKKDVYSPTIEKVREKLEVDLKNEIEVKIKKYLK